jgi:nucleotide-binding universal stress UspA family protein
MERFKNILVLYDRKVGDEASLDRATTLARLNSAKLTVVDVIEIPSSVLFGSSKWGEVGGRESFIAERQSHLDRLIHSIRQSGVDVCASVLVGKSFQEVIRAVLRDRYDLVIMTADALQGYRHSSLGPISLNLLRKCPCPVWVMQPKTGRRFQRILAALDLNQSGVSPSPIDVKVLQLASSLARIEQCRLDVLHAWNFSGSDRDTSRSEITSEIMDHLITRNKAVHETRMADMLDHIDLKDVDFEVHLPKGDPIKAIQGFASEKKVDLIVLGTAGRCGIAEIFSGNTVEYVVLKVECSILTVKPDRFVSPVSLYEYAM